MNPNTTGPNASYGLHVKTLYQSEPNSFHQNPKPYNSLEQPKYCHHDAKPYNIPKPQTIRPKPQAVNPKP